MNDRVVAFDINASLVPSAAPIAARAAAAVPTTRVRHSSRAQSRAQLAAVYAGLLGSEIAVADVLEQVQITAATDVGLDDICTALRGLGSLRSSNMPTPITSK